MKTTLTLIIILMVSLLFYSFEKEQIICSSILSYSNENLKSSVVPPPGRTGAPGDGICFNCHSSGTLNGPAGNISIEFNGGFNFYKPDSTYTINVKVKEIGSTAFGFESTVLDTNIGKTGSFGITDSITTAYQVTASREYLSHKDVFNNTSNDSLTWQFNWTAPSSNIGPVIIYSAGVENPTLVSIAAGNVYNDSLIIYPDPSITSLNEGPNLSTQLLIYPNPSKDYIFISGEKQVKSKLKARW